MVQCVNFQLDFGAEKRDLETGFGCGLWWAESVYLEAVCFYKAPFSPFGTHRRIRQCPAKPVRGYFEPGQNKVYPTPK